MDRRRVRISPSMAVALAALVVALVGSALAAEGGFENSAGEIDGCVVQKPLVDRATDGVDKATGDLLTPATDAADAVADGVDQATGDAVTKVTDPVLPKGTLLVMEAGAACPEGTRPQQILARLPKVLEASNTAPTRLGEGKSEVAGITLEGGGSYVIDALARITAPGIANAPQTIKCALVGPDGTIAGSTSSITIDANALVNRSTVPIRKVVTALAPKAKVSMACKDVAASAGAARRGASVRAAAADAPDQSADDAPPASSSDASPPDPPPSEIVTKDGCEAAGGHVETPGDPDYYLPLCAGGKAHGKQIEATADTVSTGSIQATPASGEDGTVAPDG